MSVWQLVELGTIDMMLLTYEHRTFAISGPRIWNSLPDYLKDSELSIDIFKRYLKTYFFARY